MRASYHNHTIYSDGRETPEMMFRAAVRQNLDVLGISDHFCLEHDGDIQAPAFSIQPHVVPHYIEHIRSLGTSSLQTCVGLEFDWLEGSAARLRPFAENPELDYTIGSVHYSGETPFDVNRSYWEKKSVEERDAVFRRYWCAVREMAESRLFMIAGHLDLPKKFGYAPSVDITPLVQDALDAIHDAGMVVELNTSGWAKDCAECYPSPAILAACFRRGIPVTISSDAHRSIHLTNSFSRASALLKRVGYRRIARFKAREITFDPL